MAINLFNGLVGYWPMNEGVGAYTTEDRSTHGNIGTLYNIDDSNWVDGQYGTALDFNGTDEYIDCGNDSSLNVTTGFSASTWIKPGDVTSYGTILSKLGADDAHSVMYFHIFNNYIGLRLYDSTGWQSEVTSSTIYIDTWYHVVGTYDGSNLKLYVDGVLVDSITSVPTINTNTNSLLIAHNERWTSEKYTGIIDEPRLYSRAINTDEIEHLYNTPSGIYIDLDDSLVGYWPMDEGTGLSTTEDESTNTNNGTLHNIDNTNWTNGKSGTALRFNGSNEYVNCGMDSSLNMGTSDFSISMWFNPQTFGSFHPYLSKTNGLLDGFCVFCDTVSPFDKIKLMYGGSYFIASQTQLILDTWNHVVFIHENSGYDYVYINGAIDNLATSNSVSVTSASAFTISRGPKLLGGYEYMDTITDELRFYSRAINIDEVESLFNDPYGTRVDISTYKLIVTDLNDTDHVITDDLRNLNVSIASSSSADTFSFEITNIDDEHSYIERGCEIKILAGVDGANKIKITGIITDATKQLETQLVLSVISVSGEDVGGRLKKIKFSKRYYDLEISALIKAILNDVDFSTGKTYRELADISSDYTYIESTAYSVEIASYNWKSMSSAFAELADAVGFDWYVDVDKRLHFYDSTLMVVSDTIVDDDLHGNPVINDVGEIVNRAVVIGGYQEVTDQSGATQTTTFKVTNTTSKNESFVPAEDYLSSVFIYTELETGSSSEIELSIQADSTGSPDGLNLPNGHIVVPLDSITDNGYTEFNFSNNVTLTPGETYWLVIDGTTTDGQLIGVDGSSDVDFETKSPKRVAVIANDSDSQDKYGMYIDPYRDESMIDAELAEQKANHMLNGTPKKSATVVIHGDDITANDVITLTISKTGMAIDKIMKVIKSSQTLDHRYIINSLELEEI